MPEFSAASLARLETCDYRLRFLMARVAIRYDTAIVEGHRPGYRQEALYLRGKTRARPGESLHNHYPSRAVDAAPYDQARRDIDWQDRERWHHWAGYVLGVAWELGIPVRWGGDWHGELLRLGTRERLRHSFDDLGHFELTDE